MDGNITLNLIIDSIKVRLVTSYSAFHPATTPSTIPAIRMIKVYCEFNKAKEFQIMDIEIDERYFNTYREIGLNKDNKISYFLKDSFLKFKYSNVNYGNYSIDDVRSNGLRSGYGYEGYKCLYVEDFFDFLRIENRDNKLNEILDENEAK